jgi:predicted amidohydrolase
MPRKLRVTTTSFAFPGPRTVEGNRASAAAYVDAAGAERADLVCLPETLLHAGIPLPDRPSGETIPGPTLESFRDYHARATRVQDAHRATLWPVTASSRERL